MATKTPLFRPEALAANRNSAYGAILIVRPRFLLCLTAIACTTAAALAGLFAAGSYTKHTTLRGTLVPDLGLIEVRAPQRGTITEKRVREGARVSAGAVLFVVSSERVSSERGATQEAITDQLLARRASIDAQIEQTRLLERTEHTALVARREKLGAEHRQVEAAIASQLERLRYAEETAARYRAIESQGFVAADQAAAKHEAVLEQRSRLQALERERTRIQREMADAESTIAASVVTYDSQIAELERAAGAAELELVENEARRRLLVVAPQSGVATAATPEVGQAVELGEALAIILPDSARLQARVFAPSAAVGFMEAGGNVLLRYDAFPYQKFGHRRGVIESISRAPTSGAPGAPPAYVVVVELAEQDVIAYGERRRLRAGMGVEVDVLQETRRLYEWALEPLFALGGKLH